MPDTMNGELKRLAGVAEEVVTYPLLTTAVPGNGYRGNGYGGNGTGGVNSRGQVVVAGSMTHTVQSSIRDLLGWRYRADDPKGFVAALNKAVHLTEVQGHVQATWVARPAMVQADLGEVTGAQASLYERARNAFDHAMPLLDGLKPLRPEADDESTDAIRAIVRSAWTELVSELGQVSGPRVQRVNEFFTRLLGVTSFDISFFGTAAFAELVGQPERVGGALGVLKKRFGLERELVLKVDGERVVTNFITLVGHTTAMFETWVAQKPFFERNGNADKFLGTQLVRLSQILNVIVESVHEAYHAMDSVFFGAEERQIREVVFNGDTRITVAELLEWVEHFAAVEAPQLIEDSGKDGVDAVGLTLERLRDLVRSAVTQSDSF